MNSVLVSNWDFEHSPDERSTSLIAASGNAPCICHPDRSAEGICSLKKPYGAEWRDPENVSSTMLLQGVLPEFPIAGRARGEHVPGSKTYCLLLNRSIYQRRTKARGTDSGENSLRKHCQGRFAGISPLRALDLLIGQLLRRAPVEMTGGRGVVPRWMGTLRQSSCSDMRAVA